MLGRVCVCVSECVDRGDGGGSLGALTVVDIFQKVLSFHKADLHLHPNDALPAITGTTAGTCQSLVTAEIHRQHPLAVVVIDTLERGRGEKRKRGRERQEGVSEASKGQ